MIYSGYSIYNVRLRDSGQPACESAIADACEPDWKREVLLVDSPAARHSLVERVASSVTFRKSNRLRELFLFLCERASSNPAGTLREQQIGIAVFGRLPDYDTTEDTLVRVQASQLRKKLRQYFDSEGRDEPNVIEIPKGCYSPVFRVRESLPREESEEETGRQRISSSRLTVLLALVCGIILLLTIWLALAGVSNPFRAESRSKVGRLWQDMFANGRPLYVVTSDACLVAFEDAIRHQLSLREYRNKEFLRLTNEFLRTPAERKDAQTIMTRSFTPASDAHLVGLLSRFAADRQPYTEVFARDFNSAYLQSGNVILMGSRRANPWLETFEGQLNFRTVVEENPPLAYFVNHSPLPGERQRYQVEWSWRGYCRVALLPNLDRSGNVLIISGTDMAASGAGGRFITTEAWIQALRSALHLTEKAQIPYFEVLLEADYLVTGTPRFRIVACRKLKL